MTIQAIILAVIGIIIGLFFGLLLLWEYWKKLWLTSAGIVTGVTFPSHALGRSGGITVTIRYRYIYKNKEYLGTEEKRVEAEYHQEKEALDDLLKQFPVSGKIVVFHPRSIPELSSLTPGGASIPKRVLTLTGALAFLILMYYYAKARATMY